MKNSEIGIMTSQRGRAEVWLILCSRNENKKNPSLLIYKQHQSTKKLHHIILLNVFFSFWFFICHILVDGLQHSDFTLKYLVEQ